MVESLAMLLSGLDRGELRVADVAQSGVLCHPGP